MAVDLHHLLKQSIRANRAVDRRDGVALVQIAMSLTDEDKEYLDSLASEIAEEEGAA